MPRRATSSTARNAPPVSGPVALKVSRSLLNHKASPSLGSNTIGLLASAVLCAAIATVRRLALAIRSACGIEALVWLADVAGLSRQEAAELMRWSALALLRAGLEESSDQAPPE